ncbi:MAG: hypothetical protein O7C66_08760 [Alphaproteobacteria bacterium]|nr:hypothetical protein [Alphaproteobacteria bacterium]
MNEGDHKKLGKRAGDGATDSLPDPLRARRERQALALRANLRRRKDQARRQADAGAAPAKPSGGK